MSAATVRVSRRATDYVEYTGHNKSDVAIPGRVTGDVAIPGHLTGTGVNLGHGTGAVAFPGNFIGMGKFPGQVTVPLPSLGSASFPLCSLGCYRKLCDPWALIPCCSVHWARNRYLNDPWAGYRSHYFPCALYI